MVNDVVLPALRDSGEELTAPTSAGAAGVPDDALYPMDPLSDIASVGGRSSARQR